MRAFVHSCFLYLAIPFLIIGGILVAISAIPSVWRSDRPLRMMRRNRVVFS